MKLKKTSDVIGFDWLMREGLARNWSPESQPASSNYFCFHQRLTRFESVCCFVHDTNDPSDFMNKSCLSLFSCHSPTFHPGSATVTLVKHLKSSGVCSMVLKHTPYQDHWVLTLSIPNNLGNSILWREVLTAFKALAAMLMNIHDWKFVCLWWMASR